MRVTAWTKATRLGLVLLVIFLLFSPSFGVPQSKASLKKERKERETLQENEDQNENENEMEEDTADLTPNKRSDAMESQVESQSLSLSSSIIDHLRAMHIEVPVGTSGVEMKKVPFSALHPTTKRLLEQEVSELQHCFPLLFNASVPYILDDRYFPGSRFRFQCQQMPSLSPSSSSSSSTSLPAFLSSYSIDKLHLPEFVAFKIDKPTFAFSSLEGEDYASCKERGETSFYPVTTNSGISTPDKYFVARENLYAVGSGSDKRELLQKGQLAMPSVFLTCEQKKSTYAMTNVVPMNAYMYYYSWRRGLRGLRERVAMSIPAPPSNVKTKEEKTQFLAKSRLYEPIYAVAGTYFNSAQSFYRFPFQTKEQRDREMKVDQFSLAYQPDGVWLAAVDPSRLEVDPPLATIAWLCQNRPEVPLPKADDPNMYHNGPRLCRVSLSSFSFSLSLSLSQSLSLCLSLSLSFCLYNCGWV